MTQTWKRDIDRGSYDLTVIREVLTIMATAEISLGVKIDGTVLQWMVDRLAEANELIDGGLSNASPARRLSA